MPSERQLAANRRNARNSSGPRSAGGKKRASQNAYRHGLAVTIPLGQQFAGEIERLARKMLDGRENPLALSYAQSAAEASIELARVRRAKVALIETIAALGSEALQPALDPTAETFEGDLMDPRSRGLSAVDKVVPDTATPALENPQQLEPHDEALRRALPELMRLDRYERRAASRRARALKSLNNFT
jgi:hypothetical protein